MDSLFVVVLLGLIIYWLHRIGRSMNEMANQEDVDLIVSNLNQISTNVAGIAEDQQALHAKIEELQGALGVDLSEAVALSSALVEKTQQLDAAFPTPDPEQPTE